MKMSVLSSCISQLLLLLLLLLLLVGNAAAAVGTSCPLSGLRFSIDAPNQVTAAKSFRTKVTITNQGVAWVQDLVATVSMPVQATVLKASPAGVVFASPGDPWTLVLPALSLRPGKAQTITVKATVGGAFQGTLQLAASVALSSPSLADPACAPIEATRTVAIKSKGKGRGRGKWGSSQSSSVDPAAMLVECGQPLPYLPPDFPMGFCGDRSSADPRVWGPEAWQMLHVMAQNFPTDPSQQAVEECSNFINALPFMLPSPTAGFTVAQFILANNEYAGTYDPACQASAAYGMPCTTPLQACQNQSSLVSFMLRAHSAIDVLTKPCKRLWTLQEAFQAYAYEPDFCATCIVWGTLPICKEAGETGCGVVNTTAPCGNVAPLTPSPAPPTAGPTQSPTTSSQLTVECGVVLEPSISNWAMGQCGNRTTADPRVFGPYTWRTLHRFMQHYPLSPSAETQEACVRFVNALPWLIPCPHCGYDFSQFIVDNIENAGTFSPACKANATYAMPCTTVETACSGRGLLVAFFLRAHHNVDSHNKPCKPLWSREQAADAFAIEPGFCATGIVNGRGRLCRGNGGGDEAGCVALSTTPPCGEL